MAWDGGCDVTLVWKTQVNLPHVLLTVVGSHSYLGMHTHTHTHTHTHAHTHTHSRGLIMGVWNSHTSVGNILGTIIPSFWADCDGEEDPWGWSFLVPAFIIFGLGIVMFFMLVVDPKHVGLPPPRHSLVSVCVCVCGGVNLYSSLCICVCVLVQNSIYI